MVLPTEASGGFSHGLQKGWILETLNLQGLVEWPKVEQEQARKLLLKWEHLFACSDLDLGRTSLIKHWIELRDPQDLQGALLTYTPSYVQQHEGPSPGDVGYWCHQEVTQSMG